MQCFECGELDNLHMHHVVPRSRGGTRTVPLCEECHGKAHHRKRAMTTGALTSAALQAKKARGECGARHAPYGYRAEDGQLCTNPAEVALIDAIKAASERGLSTRAIAAKLSAAGYTTRSGGPVHHVFIHRVLKGAA